MEVSRTGRETTWTTVGSGAAEVAGSSVTTGPGRSPEPTVAWLAQLVPLAVPGAMVARNTSTGLTPGTTSASAGVVEAFQVIRPPA